MNSDGRVSMRIVARAARVSRTKAFYVEERALEKLRLLSEIDPRGGNEMTPSIFYFTEPVRKMLADYPFANVLEIVERTGLSQAAVEARLLFTEHLGYTEMFGLSYRLTEEGAHSVTQSAPPLSDDPRWATDLLLAIAKHHGVSSAALLRETVGKSVLARGRLCHALRSRGWEFHAIEAKFGFLPGWAESGCARWKRVSGSNAAPPERTKARKRRTLLARRHLSASEDA